MANPLPNDDEFVSSLKRRIEHNIKQLEECASGAVQEIMYSVVNEPVEIKKQILSLLETASLCAPSQEMQQLKENMKARVHLASSKALQSLNTRIECDEGIITVTFVPAQPARVVLGTPSPTSNAGQQDSMKVASGRSGETVHLTENSRNQEEPDSDMAFAPSSSSESEAQDSGDEVLVPRGRENTTQAKRSAAVIGHSRGENQKKRRRLAPEVGPPLTVLEKHEIGDEEYTFELPYKSNRIWVFRCPICPEHRLNANCLTNLSTVRRHIGSWDSAGRYRQAQHRRLIKRFNEDNSYLIKNCIFEVMGADFDWAVMHNAKGEFSNINPRIEKIPAMFAHVEPPDRKPAQRLPQLRPTKGAPRPSTPRRNPTVADEEVQVHAQPIKPSAPPPRQEEDEIRVLGHRVRSPVTCDGKKVKVEPHSSEEE
ncbi:hypothetical protein BJ166DRAFT_594159 [Pestalotiopsis sp. NC0098]|nr:hypothetical protein BJ166DRAFT_594159 [Pestalotiopsis sp. NC0098]